MMRRLGRKSALLVSHQTVKVVEVFLLISPFPAVALIVLYAPLDPSIIDFSSVILRSVSFVNDLVLSAKCMQLTPAIKNTLNYVQLSPAPH